MHINLGGGKMRANTNKTLGDLFLDLIVTFAWLSGIFVWGATIWGIIRGLIG